ncbi:MAG: cytochrome c3 family protein [Thermodesulfovibrionales bacterium]
MFDIQDGQSYSKNMRCCGMFLAGIIILLSISAVPSYANTCIQCHGDNAVMTGLGYPQFFMTDGMVREQTHMPASCSDCHLGNPEEPSKNMAHQGLLSVRLADPKFNVLTRDDMKPADRESWGRLTPAGDNRATQILPKKVVDGKLRDHPDFNLVLWQDKNPGTFAFNPVLAEKTCGKCHEGVVQKFLKSSMGGARGAHTQSQYRAWTGPAGPQSCGIWTGALSQPDQERFSDENMRYYNAHSTMPVTEKTAHNNQRTCNKCHVGCLDCHLDVSKQGRGKGQSNAHSFVKKPSSLSCYGGGKAFICHAGPLERRRGDGYLRGEFTQAARKGKEILKDRSDIHAQKGLVCVDCHAPNQETNAHADLRRDVSCKNCHGGVVTAHGAGSHKKVDCAACHTTLIGGYAFNFWSAVGPEGQENPITRIQDYQVEAVRPLLIKNPKGNWIPVHLVPHTSGNVKSDEVKLSKRLMFRNSPDVKVDRRYFSNDSYAITGLARNLDSRDHDTMVWFNLDRVAHATGKSLSCDACHASGSQKIITRFEGGSYKELEDGEYTIIADKKGLRVTDFKDPETGAIPKDLLPLKDKWSLKGDFSLPMIKNKALYRKMEAGYKKGTYIH